MEIQKNNFLGDNTKLVLEFDYTNCFDLIHEWLAIPSIISKIYKCFFYAMCIIFIISILLKPNLHHIIINFGFAVVFFLAFIGGHQFLHLIAAYLMGFRNVKLVVPKANIFCYCNKTEFNANKYIFVSIFPFAFATILSIIIAIIFPEYLGAVAIFNIFHVTISNGDIGITNYFLKNKDLYFYCNQAKNTAYIYKKL